MDMRVMICALLSFIFGGIISGYYIVKSRFLLNEKIKDENIKMREFYNLLVKWIGQGQKGKTIDLFLEKKQYHTVAIYGMRELGELLLGELQNSNNVEVKYVVDRNAVQIECGKKICKPSDELEPVDVMIVTAVHYFDSIKEELINKVNCDIVSLEEIVIELENGW